MGPTPEDAACAANPSPRRKRRGTSVAVPTAQQCVASEGSASPSEGSNVPPPPHRDQRDLPFDRFTCNRLQVLVRTEEQGKVTEHCVGKWREPNAYMRREANGLLCTWITAMECNETFQGQAIKSVSLLEEFKRV